MGSTRVRRVVVVQEGRWGDDNAGTQGKRVK